MKGLNIVQITCISAHHVGKYTGKYTYWKREEVRCHSWECRPHQFRFIVTQKVKACNLYIYKKFDIMHEIHYVCKTLCN